MTQRIYIPFNLFGVRIVNMQHLWAPSTEYKGQQQQKPSWFITAITPKTRANWWEEPLLAPCWNAYSELLQKSGMTPQHVSEWPIKDGEMPPEPGKSPSEWAKGHWLVGGSTSTPMKVEIAQNGNCVPLPAKVGVKPGDFVALGLSAAVKQNNPRAIKHFCNTVLFTAPGEEIAVGNSVSGAELMRTAQQQGLQIAGFSAAPGFSGGFPGHAGPAASGVGGPGGFPQAGAPGFPPANSGFAPGQASGFQPGGPVTSTAPGQYGPAGNGNVTYPSNQGAPGFTSTVAGPGAANAQQPGPGSYAPIQGGPATAFPSSGTPNFAPGGPQFPSR